MPLKNILVLPLYKVLAIVRTILKYTQTHTHLHWRTHWYMLKNDKRKLRFAEHIVLKLNIWHKYTYNFTHTYTQTQALYSLSLRLSLYITVMRFFFFKNGCIQRFYCGAFLIYLNTQICIVKSAIFKFYTITK